MYLPKLKKHYTETVSPALRAELKMQNFHQIPRVSKVVVNAGLGASIEKSSIWDQAERDLSLLAAQKVVTTLASKSIAGFKIRTGMKIGQKVTIRRDRMYDFITRFVEIAVPRIRDFRGFQESAIDTHGNFSFGIREHTIFPEIQQSEKEAPLSLQVTIVTTAQSHEQGMLLFKKLGFPFMEKDK